MGICEAIIEGHAPVVVSAEIAEIEIPIESRWELLEKMARDFIKSKNISGRLEIKGIEAVITGLPMCGGELPICSIKKGEDGHYWISMDPATLNI